MLHHCDALLLTSNHSLPFAEIAHRVLDDFLALVKAREDLGPLAVIDANRHALLPGLAFHVQPDEVALAVTTKATRRHAHSVGFLFEDHGGMSIHAGIERFFGV